MATIILDGKEYQVNDGDNLLEAGLSLKKELPYFCWHPALGSVGSCRLCAVKQFANAEDKKGRLVMACMTPVTDGAIFALTDPQVQDFRGTVIESLMTNHPHDCPVCEEGGECHLQDMTEMSGHTIRHYRGKKRTHVNQYLGPLINHEMNRCIGCYRCVRFYDQYAGGKDLQALASHNHVYFGRYQPGVLQSEFAGNLVEVCPTGVFTDKPFSEHYSRKWDLQSAPSICSHCAVGCNTSPSERYGTIRRVVNRYNSEVNSYFLCDRGRFGYAYSNSKNRLTHVSVGEQQVPDCSTIQQLSEVLLDSQQPQTELLGVGSTRASMENNYALMQLVGADNFYLGLSDDETQVLNSIAACLASDGVNTPTLAEIEAADAVVILAEDVSNTAPRIALAIRQSVRNKSFDIAAKNRVSIWQDNAVRAMAGDQRSPLCIAGVRASRLSDIAQHEVSASPASIARMGSAIAARLEGSTEDSAGLNPAQQQWLESVCEVLVNSKRPLIVTGSGCVDHRVVDAAGQIYRALKQEPARFYACLPDSNSLGLGLLCSGKGQSLAALLKRVNNNKELEQQKNYSLLVLENNLQRHLQGDELKQLLGGINHSIIFDHSRHDFSDAVDRVFPVPTVLESQGTFISAEGRAQRFFAVKKADSQIKQTWQWLAEGLRQLVTDGSTMNSAWKELADCQYVDQLTLQCSKFNALLVGMDEAAPLCVDDSQASARKLSIARQPLRYSGRTAMNAIRKVAEGAAQQDEESLFNYSMEGGVGSGALRPFVWSPGWNSNQSLHKFQQEINGPLIGGSGGVRLLDGASAELAEKVSVQVSSPSLDSGEILLLPGYEVFGSEEWSVAAQAIQQLSPYGYIAANKHTAAALHLQDWDTVTYAVGSDDYYRSFFRVDNSVADNVAVVSIGCEGAPALLPTVCVSRVSLSEPPLPRPPELIASDKGGCS